MSRGTTGGPIRRRPGERHRTEPAQPCQRGSDDSSARDEPAPPPSAEPPRQPRTTTPGHGRGRRVFVPGGDRGDRGSSPHGSPQAPRPAGSRPRGREGATGADPTQTAEKERQRAEAQELAKAKGIPVAHALRIVRGQATLNEVLKTLMHRERIERLVTHDGIDRGLAGQVATGQLAKERALLITRIRQYRKHRLDRDALKLAALAEEPVAMAVFGRGWLTGRVVGARTYEFDFVAAGADAPETFLKHDVKALAATETIAAVVQAIETDAEVRAEGLLGTPDRQERVRPKDERLIDLVEAGGQVALIMRDGDVFRGTMRSFGRWDLDIELEGGGVATVLFHALHKRCSFLEG